MSTSSGLPIESTESGLLTGSTTKTMSSYVKKSSLLSKLSQYRQDQILVLNELIDHAYLQICIWILSIC